MAEKLDPKETVSFEELLMSNVYTQEALIKLLEKKRVITKAEMPKRNLTLLTFLLCLPLLRIFLPVIFRSKIF